MKVFKGIENIVEDNIYTIKYLTEFEGEDNKNNEENTTDNKEENIIGKDNDEIDMIE